MGTTAEGLIVKLTFKFDRRTLDERIAAMNKAFRSFAMVDLGHATGGVVRSHQPPRPMPAPAAQPESNTMNTPSSAEQLLPGQVFTKCSQCGKHTPHQEGVCLNHAPTPSPTAEKPADGPATARQYPHYFKDVRGLDFIDIYRMLELLEIQAPALQHAFKKIAAAGKRGAKNEEKDLREAVDSINRHLAMRAEDRMRPTAQDERLDDYAKRLVDEAMKIVDLSSYMSGRYIRNVIEFTMPNGHMTTVDNAMADAARKYMASKAKPDFGGGLV